MSHGRHRFNRRSDLCERCANYFASCAGIPFCNGVAFVEDTGDADDEDDASSDAREGTPRPSVS